MHGNTYHTRQISSDEEAILEVLAGFVKGWNLHNVSLFALPAAKENEIGEETDKQYALTGKPSINSCCQWSRENEGTFTNACLKTIHGSTRRKEQPYQQTQFCI